MYFYPRREPSAGLAWFSMGRCRVAAAEFGSCPTASNPASTARRKAMIRSITCSVLSRTMIFSPVLRVTTVSGALSMNLMRSELTASSWLFSRVRCITEDSFLGPLTGTSDRLDNRHLPPDSEADPKYVSNAAGLLPSLCLYGCLSTWLREGLSRRAGNRKAFGTTGCFFRDLLRHHRNEIAVVPVAGLSCDGRMRSVQRSADGNTIQNREFQILDSLEGSLACRSVVPVIDDEDELIFQRRQSKGNSVKLVSSSMRTVEHIHVKTPELGVVDRTEITLNESDLRAPGTEALEVLQKLCFGTPKL